MMISAIGLPVGVVLHKQLALFWDAIRAAVAVYASFVVMVWGVERAMFYPVLSETLFPSVRLCVDLAARAPN